ncbi:hypothetical protein PoB_001060300 [Plakobranchus ocellatus]|uniref:Uncharacterized protein n=1 Tax=Plakobranchus ocellatus TaxID=259542 RepID=A0AAV3YPB2_9GAST|nr:hypothetical protein PoB_001060300 [Plakobranchus ocellatus]
MVGTFLKLSGSFGAVQTVRVNKVQPNDIQCQWLDVEFSSWCGWQTRPFISSSGFSVSGSEYFCEGERLMLLYAPLRLKDRSLPAVVLVHWLQWLSTCKIDAVQTENNPHFQTTVRSPVHSNSPT